MDQTRRIIAHVDLDMFYASIVLRDDPSLIGKALIIGNPNARVSKRGVVLTCSYEARKFGVRSGMSMLEALKRCPDAEIRRSNYDENSRVSKSIMDHFKSIGVPVRVTSIDEAYLDITDLVEDIYAAFGWAKKIKSWILENESITASVGVGHTKIIAKIASDYNKPNGITIVTHLGQEEFFYNLSFRKIPGIGNKSANWIKQRGYTKIGQVIDNPIDARLHLGSTADFILRIVNGETSTDLITKHNRKSISHERTFHSEDKDVYYYLKKLEFVFQKTHEVLVSKNLLTKTVTVKMRYVGFETITRAKSLPEYTDDREMLHKTVVELVQPYLSDSRGFRLLGVKFSNFIKLKYDKIDVMDYFG